ncbi:hypothetical protein CHS0354_006382 [Potamilus streckersoni]|uniref:C2H2-type domain-containing protein n=1 Tax=Potamilus streckersoni TaxID=2493646 RepID=A0AAE0SEX7_9BIVA|nr:hypothetical protein CHS0354_006382 [Potamilus streckersoni]
MAKTSMECNESQSKSVSSTTKILAKVRGYSREHKMMDQRVDIEDSVLDLSKSVLDLSKKSAVKQEWTNREEQEMPLDLSTKDIKGNSWPGHSGFLTEQECALDLSRPFQSTSSHHLEPLVPMMNIASPSSNQTLVSVGKGTLSFGINKQPQPLSKNQQYPYLAQSLTLDESVSDRYGMTQTLAQPVEQFVNQSSADQYGVTQTADKSFEHFVNQSSAGHYGITQTEIQCEGRPELESPGPPLLLPVSRAPPPLIPVPPFRNNFDLLNLSPPNLVNIDSQSPAISVSGSSGQISRPESRGDIECDGQTASCLFSKIPTAPISQIKELLANKLQRNKFLGEEIERRKDTSLNKDNNNVLSFQRIDQRLSPEINNSCSITSPYRTDGNESNKNDDVDSSNSGNMENRLVLTRYVSASSDYLQNLGHLESNEKSLSSQMDLEEESKKVKEVASVLLSFTSRHQISLKRDSEDAPLEGEIIHRNEELNFQKDIVHPSSCKVDNDLAMIDSCSPTDAKRRKTPTKDENDNVESELTEGMTLTESEGKVIMSLRCKFCQKKFRTRRKVSFSEEAKKNFNCKTCHNKCKEKESKTSETKTVEDYSPFSFSCEICKKSLNTAQQLFIHKASHLSKKPKQGRPRYPAEKVKCPECSRLFSSAYQLRLHMTTHKKEVDTSEVQLVPSKISNPKENSSRRQYNYKNTCYVCGQRFRLKRTLNVHMGSHTEKETTDNTEKQNSLILELLSQYTGQGKETKHGLNSEETQMVTRDSEMKSPGKQKLKQNAEEKNENCDTENNTEKSLSQKLTKTKSFVKKKRILMKNATSGNNDLFSEKEQFQCDTCSEIFARKLDLIIHAATHKSLGPYLCEMCGKSFQRRGNLEVHLRLHSETLAYRCHLCGKKFASKAFQIRHMFWHKLPCKPKKLFDSSQSLSRRTSKLRDIDDVEDGEKTNMSDDKVDLEPRSEQLEITMSIANDIKESLSDSKDNKQKLESKRRNSRLTDQSKKSPSTHPYRCEKCCNRFTHRSSLLRHKKSHCLGFRSPSPLEVESDDSDELMKEVFPTNHNQPAEGEKDVKPIVNQSECLNLYEPVQEESRGSPSDLLRFISQFNKLEGSLSDGRVSSLQEQHSNVNVENQSSIDAKSENCSMLNGKKCEELLKVLTSKELGSVEISEIHDINQQPDYTGNTVSIATVATVCSSQSSPSLQSIGNGNEFLSKLSVLSSVCSSIVTAEQSLFEAKSQVNEAREVDVSIRQNVPSFLDNQEIQEEHIRIPSVVFEVAKASGENKQKNVKEISKKKNMDVETEKEVQEEVQKEQTKFDIVEANEERKSQSGSNPSGRSKNISNQIQNIMETSSQTGSDTLPSLPNLTELSDSIIKVTTVPLTENMPKLPPLLNVFKCQLCAKLLFDYELQVHLSTHRQECDNDSCIKAEHIPNPGTSQWNLPMTEEITDEQYQKYMHGAESKGDSTEIVIPARRIQRRHTFDQISTESEVNEKGLRPELELRRSLSNLSQISTDDTDTTYGRSSDYSSSDVSSEPFSTPTTPNSSIPLAKLREELRNKIWARRKSQGLEELKIEFKPPEHAELSEEEKSRQNARRESNRQAAQRSRMRRRFILDSLMTVRHTVS